MPDSCETRRTTVGDAPAVTSTGDPAATHIAIAVAAEPQFFVLSLGFDGGNSIEVVRTIAGHVAAGLARVDVAEEETPRLGSVTVGAPAPEIAGPVVGGGSFSLLASIGHPMVVLVPPQVGPAGAADVAVTNVVLPPLEDLIAIAAFADASTTFVCIAEPEVDWLGIRDRVETKQGPAARRIQFVSHSSDDGGVAGILPQALTRAGPARLVVIDADGRVAAYQPWHLVQVDEVLDLLGQLSSAS